MRNATWRVARPLQSTSSRGAGNAARGGFMGKYFIAWLLGVPLTLLVLIYFVSQAFC